MGVVWRLEESEEAVVIIQERDILPSTLKEVGSRRSFYFFKNITSGYTIFFPFKRLQNIQGLARGQKIQLFL